jgi:hypothetical protein
LKRQTANTPFEEKYNGISPQDKAEKIGILWYADFGENSALNVPTDNLHFPELLVSFGCTYKHAAVLTKILFRILLEKCI